MGYSFLLQPFFTEKVFMNLERQEKELFIFVKGVDLGIP